MLGPACQIGLAGPILAEGNANREDLLTPGSALVRIVRTASIAALTATLSMSCSTSTQPDYRPTCQRWETLKDQVRRGLPLPGINVLLDDLANSASISGYDELPGLVDRLTSQFALIDPNDTRQLPPGLASAEHDLEMFCVSHGSPTPSS